MEKKYYVFDRNWRHVEFDSYTELLGFLSICDNYRSWYSVDDEAVAKYSKYFYYIDKKQYWDYEVFNDSFNRIDTKKLKREVADYISLRRKQEYRRRDNPWWWYYYGMNYLGFRNGPIPRTGNHSRLHKSYRRPKTMSEIRANNGEKDFVRGKRKYLPTTWDDVRRANLRSKSWKNRKVKRQWM